MTKNFAVRQKVHREANFFRYWTIQHFLNKAVVKRYSRLDLDKLSLVGSSRPDRKNIFFYLGFRLYRYVFPEEVFYLKIPRLSAEKSISASCANTLAYILQTGNMIVSFSYFYWMKASALKETAELEAWHLALSCSDICVGKLILCHFN